MRKRLVVILLCVWPFALLAQQTQPIRYEIEKISKDQQCPFELLQEQGLLYAFKTNNASEKDVLWSFVRIDTSLLEVRNDRIPLPLYYDFFSSASNGSYSVFLFQDAKVGKSDSLGIRFVIFNRQSNTFTAFDDKLSPGSVLLDVSLAGNALFVPVNSESVGGGVLFYDLENGSRRVLSPKLDDRFVLFHSETDKKTNIVVIAAKEFSERRHVATSFFQYDSDGNLLRTNRYVNEGGVTIGRMCFDLDRKLNLSVFATLETVDAKKVDLKGVTGDFEKTSVRVACIRFAGGKPSASFYLFKDMPDIERALTTYDRVKVREERLKRKSKGRDKRKEIGFQFLSPCLLKTQGETVLSLEAFVPEYHTETRMDYGIYGMFPYSYTVFDGYDFVSNVQLAFDSTGTLLWQNSVRFDNALSYDLCPHSDIACCADELIVMSSSDNSLRYEVFDGSGQLLLDQRQQPLDLFYETDFLTDERYSSVSHWYGNRFIVSGEQTIQNGVHSKPHRTVFFWQRVQFE